MMSSVMPSLKYSCSGSPLMLAKGRTAIEGFEGRSAIGLAVCTASAAPDDPVDPHRLRHILQVLLAEILEARA